MKHKRVWAWILLATLLVGIVCMMIALFSGSDGPVGTVGVVLMIVSAIGTYFLRKKIDEHQEGEGKDE